MPTYTTWIILRKLFMTPLTYEDIIKVASTSTVEGEALKSYQVGYLASWILRLSKDDYNLRKEIQYLLAKRKGLK